MNKMNSQIIHWKVAQGFERKNALLWSVRNAGHTNETCRVSLPSLFRFLKVKEENDSKIMSRLCPNCITLISGEQYIKAVYYFTYGERNTFYLFYFKQFCFQKKLYPLVSSIEYYRSLRLNFETSGVIGAVTTNFIYLIDGTACTASQHEALLEMCLLRAAREKRKVLW